MTRAKIRIVTVETPVLVPQYELRIRTWGPADDEFEVWQVRVPSAPHVRSAVRVAGLRGRNLELVHHRLLKRLANAGVRIGQRRLMEVVRKEPAAYAITGHLALMLELLFRTLAPMQSRVNMLRVAEGIEAMGQEEAAYWLGMAMHRTNPRRVLSALRMLLTDPARRVDERR